MNKSEWQHRNLINIALDLGCTEDEVRQAFEGGLEMRQFLEKQLQACIDERKAKGKVEYSDNDHVFSPWQKNPKICGLCDKKHD